MAIEQVKAFYERLSSDQSFYRQLKSTTSKAECKQVVKLAGYSFTDAEFEDYTAQLLGSETPGDRLDSLNERELEGVLGGASIFMQGSVQVSPYGHSPDLYL
jgi:predicted ribosomally synthesized peptide with nif11-like leader